jgi:hypothetical protein
LRALDRNREHDAVSIVFIEFGDRGFDVGLAHIGSAESAGALQELSGHRLARTVRHRKNLLTYRFRRERHPADDDGENLPALID